jgi:alcohol dehydrogenase class IV
MPSVLNAIRGARVPELAFVARCLDQGLNADDEAAAAQAPELIARLGDRVGIPRGLEALGMQREVLPEMAQLAFGVKRLIDNSPVSFDEEALLHILEEAY